IELGSTGELHSARLDGRPAVALTIHPLNMEIDAKDLDTAFQNLMQPLRSELPDGLALDVAFDFPLNAPPDAPLVYVELPGGASAERTLQVLEQCDKIIRSINGVTRTLVSTDDPFAAPRARPCILVEVDPKKKGQERDQIVSELRQRLRDNDAAAAVRVN